jgi:hypothetical protein
VVLYGVGCNCFRTRFSSGDVTLKDDGICQKVSAGFKVDAKRPPVLDSIPGYIPESIFLHASYTELKKWNYNFCNFGSVSYCTGYMNSFPTFKRCIKSSVIAGTYVRVCVYVCS